MSNTPVASTVRPFKLCLELSGCPALSYECFRSRMRLDSKTLLGVAFRLVLQRDSRRTVLTLRSCLFRGDRNRCVSADYGVGGRVVSILGTSKQQFEQWLSMCKNHVRALDADDYSWP